MIERGLVRDRSLDEDTNLALHGCRCLRGLYSAYRKLF